ncbi:unnamed protein product [Thlaspi arvense]|uniref:Uncharacterized protein n=1 Tax=Thlaspi arvense TaxID=13288 RepID=A0AAU9SNG8_THLAR|nr:unnamed protein product [Thlaspi arvense]
MKASMSIIIFFAVVLCISAISLAKMSPEEACIRKNIGQSLSPSPSNETDTTHFEVADEICRDETRIIMYFLKLNGKFPPYYVRALCNVFGNDVNKLKEYVTKKWLNHSEKLINSLTCIRRNILIVEKSPVEACIRRNIAQSLSPSPSNKPETSRFKVMEDQFCSEETRVIMYFLKLNGKFPAYYVRALCNVFGNDEKKLKEYVTKKWLNHSENLINSLTCASR